jgi:transcriptional regulator GlxA family with amidase domain
MGELMASNGNLSIEKISSLACLSRRQFDRKCKERIGMTPKLYARIARFSKAYRLREAMPDRNWTGIAYEACYFDQRHMIRDYKEFTGMAPAALERYLAQTPLHMQASIPLWRQCWKTARMSRDFSILSGKSI